MSQLVLDLQAAGNWEQIYSEQRDAVIITPTSWVPIPAFEVGVTLEHHLIVIKTQSRTAKSHWRFAGYLSQKFQLGTGGTNSPLPTVDATRRSVKLNKSELIFFPRYTNTYRLSFEPIHWLKDIQTSIWEYKGIISDSTEEILEAMRVDLARIEMKVDVL